MIHLEEDLMMEEASQTSQLLILRLMFKDFLLATLRILVKVSLSGQVILMIVYLMMLEQTNLNSWILSPPATTTVDTLDLTFTKIHSRIVIIDTQTLLRRLATPLQPPIVKCLDQIPSTQQLILLKVTPVILLDPQLVTTIMRTLNKSGIVILSVTASPPPSTRLLLTKIPLDQQALGQVSQPLAMIPSV